jgi:hypothetical protein
MLYQNILFDDNQSVLFSLPNPSPSPSKYRVNLDCPAINIITVECAGRITMNGFRTAIESLGKF